MYLLVGVLHWNSSAYAMAIGDESTALHDACSVRSECMQHEVGGAKAWSLVWEEPKHEAWSESSESMVHEAWIPECRVRSAVLTLPRLGFLGFDRTGGGPKCPHPLIFLKIMVWPPNLAWLLTMWYLIDPYDFYLMTSSWRHIMTSLRIVTSYDVVY